eukprot:3473262-Rhodomonas_salina.1
MGEKAPIVNFTASLISLTRNQTKSNEIKSLSRTVCTTKAGNSRCFRVDGQLHSVLDQPDAATLAESQQLSRDKAR